MIPKECKRLAEVDFPIALVSQNAPSEKSARHGHPSTLHLWWARRPLAACRAVLMALLLPDPCHPKCPASFKKAARGLLSRVTGKIDGDNQSLRSELLRFIGEASSWHLAKDRTYLEVARGLISAATQGAVPLVVDPFAGGGSIPLEALRLGCDAFATDLNPVACLILKVMLEHIPRHRHQLADRLREQGEGIRQKAARGFAQLYPKGKRNHAPLAYIWARTVRCESPDCGAQIPIYRSAFLAKRDSSRARYFKEADDGESVALLIDEAPKGGPIRFRIAKGYGSQQTRPGYTLATGTKVPGRTANVKCPCCGVVLPGTRSNNRTAVQLSAQKGGADVQFDEHGDRIGGAYLLAVVERGDDGKSYRLPEKTDYAAVLAAHERLAELDKRGREDGLPVVPDETLPLMSGTFNAPIYGVRTWGDMFTARQKIALLHLLDAISDTDDAAPRAACAAVLGRSADYWSSGTRWVAAGEFVANTFGRQALPIVWDFAETCPWQDTSGSFEGAVDWVARVIEAWPGDGNVAQVQQEDAQVCPLPDDSAHVWFTDPPYYFAVPYADLSDYFLVWLKRTKSFVSLISQRFPLEHGLAPKEKELCEMAHWDSERYSHKDKTFFEEGMRGAFSEGCRVLQPDGIGCTVFAHKTTEGWEALLSGMVRGGWVITASWPIATERPSRLRSQQSAALATSVHLICRPRSADAPIADWGEVFRELPRRVRDWMERLQTEGVRGADLVFASIGPALEIYSRYSKVVDAEDRPIPLGGKPEAAEPHKRGYLAYVWEAVGRIALEQVLGTAEAPARNGVAGVLEEDSRLTALFLWTRQTTAIESENGDQDVVDAHDDDVAEDEGGSRKKKGQSLPFDVVRRFAQPLGIHLPVWEERIIETERGVVRLLPVTERARQLFGEGGAEAVAYELERSPSKAQSAQMLLFPDAEAEERPRRRGRRRGTTKTDDEELATRWDATTLDRVHAAMLLQASGRAHALRALLKSEIERSPDFMRLANALSALYPRGSDEKRLLDAMLLAVPR